MLTPNTYIYNWLSVNSIDSYNSKLVTIFIPFKGKIVIFTTGYTCVVNCNIYSDWLVNLSIFKTTTFNVYVVFGCKQPYYNNNIEWSY